MPRTELLLIPNLLSLSRIVLTPVVGYFLWRNDPLSTLICLGLLVIAALTDALDGYFARRMNLTSNLGLILDPLADKIFAAVLIVELILFREFPIWLAVAIISRDVLILLAGLMILGKKKVTSSSTLTGKYAFFSIVILIVCSVIRFDSGMKIVAVCTLTLLTASIVVYARLFFKQLRGEVIRPFVDRRVYQVMRIGSAGVILLYCLWIYLAEQSQAIPSPW